jgi:hypothetical protein
MVDGPWVQGEFAVPADGGIDGRVARGLGTEVPC